MIEIPEAQIISQQINKNLKGKTIKSAIAMNTPHKLVWTFKDHKKYSEMLINQTILNAISFGGTVEIKFTNSIKIAFSDGFNLRYITKEKDVPKKHQILLEFSDATYLVAYVQMYGGLACFEDEEYDNKYYVIAKEKPSPTSKDFTKTYWDSLFIPEIEKLTAKAFLATEQRIPGLGNGVLQDILFNANIHPKRKINSMSKDERDNLYETVISTLIEMIEKGGRDTEKDLLSEEGRYITKMSNKTAGKPCPTCGTEIKKMAYLGGSVYFCEKCQPLV